MKRFATERLAVAVALALGSGAGQTANLADNDDGTLTDSESGLVWLRCSVGQTWSGSSCSGSSTTLDWWNATALNGAVSFAGASDWRVPTLDELKTLDTAVDASNFPNNYQDSFWSATDEPDYQAGDYAYEIYYAYPGATGQQYLDRKSVNKYVRLVRGPATLDPEVPASTEDPSDIPDATNPTDSPTSTDSRLSISLDELSEMITSLQYPVDTPSVFFDTDPLGIDGVSLANASAQYAGDTLRLLNVSIGDQSNWLDFSFDPQSGRFALTQAGSSYPNTLRRSDIPGLDTTSVPVIAAVMGPPLKADVVPLKLGAQYYGATLAFDAASLSFGLESVREFSEAAADVLKGESTQVTTDALKSRARVNTSAGSDAIEEWITQQGNSI
jgi:hypothetical protein